MNEPPKRGGAETSRIGFARVSKLDDFLCDHRGAFVGAEPQLRRLACHSKGGTHRFEDLGSKVPYFGEIGHRSGLRSNALDHDTASASDRPYRMDNAAKIFDSPGSIGRLAGKVLMDELARTQQFGEIRPLA
jgi:hypothetical protein